MASVSVNSSSSSIIDGLKNLDITPSTIRTAADACGAYQGAFPKSAPIYDERFINTDVRGLLDLTGVIVGVAEVVDLSRAEPEVDDSSLFQDPVSQKQYTLTKDSVSTALTGLDFTVYVLNKVGKTVTEAIGSVVEKVAGVFWIVIDFLGLAESVKNLCNKVKVLQAEPTKKSRFLCIEASSKLVQQISRCAIGVILALGLLLVIPGSSGAIFGLTLTIGAFWLSSFVFKKLSENSKSKDEL